jgi:hypothetical protein
MISLIKHRPPPTFQRSTATNRRSRGSTSATLGDGRVWYPADVQFAARHASSVAGLPRQTTGKPC